MGNGIFDTLATQPATPNGNGVFDQIHADSSAPNDAGVWNSIKRNTIGAITGLHDIFTRPADAEEQQAVDAANKNPTLALTPDAVLLAAHRLLVQPAEKTGAQAANVARKAYQNVQAGNYGEAAGQAADAAATGALATVPLLGPWINSVANRATGMGESGTKEQAPDIPGAATDLAFAVLGENTPAALKAAKNYFDAPESTLANWQKTNEVIGAKPSNIILPKSATGPEDAVIMPARGLEKIGLDADKLADMDPMERLQAVAPATRKAGAAIDSAVSAATDKGITLDGGESANQVLKRIANPNLQQMAIDKFNELQNEIGISNMREATPTEVLQLRRSLQSGARFGPNGDLASLGGIRAQLYSAVSSDLKDAVPDLAPLDRQFADLNSATKAIQKGATKWLTETPPSTLEKIMADPFKRQLLKAAVYSTGIGLGIGGTGLAYRFLTE